MFRFRDDWAKILAFITVVTILAWITMGIVYSMNQPPSPGREQRRREFVDACQRSYGAVAYTEVEPWRCDRP